VGFKKRYDAPHFPLPIEESGQTAWILSASLGYAHANPPHAGLVLMAGVL
jgi:hypothetical protein